MESISQILNIYYLDKKSMRGRSRERKNEVNKVNQGFKICFTKPSISLELNPKFKCFQIIVCRVILMEFTLIIIFDFHKW